MKIWYVLQAIEVNVWILKQDQTKKGCCSWMCVHKRWPTKIIYTTYQCSTENWLCWLSVTWTTATSMALKSLTCCIKLLYVWTGIWSKDGSPVIHLLSATVVVCQKDAVQWVISWVISFNIQFWYSRPVIFSSGWGDATKTGTKRLAKMTCYLWLLGTKNSDLYVKDVVPG